MPIFRCVFHSPFVTGLFGSIFNPPFPFHLQVTSHPSTRSSGVPYLPSEKMCTALPPLSSNSSQQHAGLTCHAVRPPWHHQRPLRPLTQSRLNTPVPHHQTEGKPTTLTSPCQGKPQAPLHFLILVHLHCLPSKHLPPQPDGGPPDPPHPLHHLSPCLPPCSPLDPRLLAFHQAALHSHQLCCRHNLSLWSPNQWSEWGKKRQTFYTCILLCFFYIFIDIRPSF